MEFTSFFNIFSLTFLFCIQNALQAAESTQHEAQLECATLHRVELQNFPSANASYSESKCRLNCLIGNLLLASDSLHEGQPCPLDSSGICHKGHCTGGVEQALNECGTKHSLDFHLMKDHKGTGFINQHCALQCVLDGTTLSTINQNEGSRCPGNSNGICRSGSCELVEVSTVPATSAPFSLNMVKYLNITTSDAGGAKFISIESVYMYLCEDGRKSYQDNLGEGCDPVCFIQPDHTLTPDTPISCYKRDLASHLRPTSRLLLMYATYVRNLVDHHSVDMFELLERFYHNRDNNRTPGTKESFSQRYNFRDNGKVLHTVEVHFLVGFA